MAEEVTISGLSELRDTLNNRLPEALRGKAAQRALASASKPIVDMAKNLAPSRGPRGFSGPLQPGKEAPPGLLRRSIHAYRNRQSTKTYESRLIGVRKRAWYWRFIEFGRGSISSDKSMGTPGKGFFGKTVQAVPARPFLRPAFETLKYRAIQIFADALKPAIEKVAAQARRRGIRRITKKLTGF